VWRLVSDIAPHLAQWDPELPREGGGPTRSSRVKDWLCGIFQRFSAFPVLASAKIAIAGGFHTGLGRQHGKFSQKQTYANVDPQGRGVKLSGTQWDQ